MLFRSRPVYLPNRDGHGAWVNTRALEIAGIDAGTPDPADGRIEREADGFPAGTLHEGASHLIDHHLPGVTPDAQRAGLLAAQEHLFSLGVTSWQDAAVGSMFGQDDILPIYLDAAESGDLVAHLVALTDGGADYTFDCTGNTAVMRTAWKPATAAGAKASSSAWRKPARKSPPARSS